MGREFSRVGGAAAGIIAILFGVLDLMNKVPSPWLLIALGTVAVIGVLIDYFWGRRGDEGGAPQQVNQKQKGGQKSTLNQAGRDVTINPSPREDRR